VTSEELNHYYETCRDIGSGWRRHGDGGLSPAVAEYKIGFITSLSGPAAFQCDARQCRREADDRLSP